MYVGNNPLVFVDPTGLDSIYLTYIKDGDKKLRSYYFDETKKGAFAGKVSVKSYGASNNVRTQTMGNPRRTTPNVESIPEGKNVFPKTFPVGIWNILETYEIKEGERAGEVGFRTDAFQELPTYEVVKNKENEITSFTPTGKTTTDGGYNGHSIENLLKTTLGCVGTLLEDIKLINSDIDQVKDKAKKSDGSGRAQFSVTELYSGQAQVSASDESKEDNNK